MTSPVDTSVKYFDSTMANAPALSGTAGSLIALLDACLKDGFNAVTLSSLVVSGGVATATWPGTHAALKDTVVLISGVTGGPTGWAGLNGEQKVVAKLTGTTLSFATATADGAATGTIVMKMAPLGFTKPFSGTNLAAYKSSDPASPGFLLRVDDTAAQTARVLGYEQMTDINTGVGPFPTTAQIPGGGYWAKSTAASATANQWNLVGDGRFFYLNIQPGSNASANNQLCSPRGFGDCVGIRPGGDPYACVLNYSATASAANQYDGHLGLTNSGGCAVPREFTGLGSAQIAGNYIYGSSSTGVISGGSNAQHGAFPSAVDGSLLLGSKMLNTPTLGVVPRAYFPGCYHVLQSAAWSTLRMGDRTPGAGALAGRNLYCSTCDSTSITYVNASSVSNTGIIVFDITGPWR